MAEDNKYPELRKQLAALQKERDEILAELNPVRAERDQIVAKIAPFTEKIDALGKRIKQLSQPRLAELDNQIGALTRAMGGRSITAE